MDGELKMNLKLPKKNMINKIESMQNILENAREESTKAKAQEEVLLKQMNDLFECETLEEGKELLDLLIEEKDELDSELETETNDLYEKMKADGLIK
jgi:hypothetical protein